MPSYNTKTDKLYEMWLKSLSERTAATYKYWVLAYCDFTRKTCPDLIIISDINPSGRKQTAKGTVGLNILFNKW